MSKICTNCGAQIPDESAFCGNCGTAVQAQQIYDQPVQQPPPIQQETPGQQIYAQPVQQMPPIQQEASAQQIYAQPVQQMPPIQQEAPAQQIYAQPVQQMPYVQPAMQPAAVKTKKSKYPVIITIVAIFLAIALVLTLIFNPFGQKSALAPELEASFSKLCDMTSLDTQSYSFARLMTEQLLETDLASADPEAVDELFTQCLDAWKATEEVSNNLISLSGELAANEKIKNTRGNVAKISATYARPDLVDFLFPFTIKASAANEGDISTEVTEAASPADSVDQCTKLGTMILSDAQKGYSAVEKLRSIYSGRTTPVQDWNNAVSSMGTHFSMKFYVSGEITSGEFTTLPNGAHSVHTISNAIKGGTIGVSNTDILVDIGSSSGCIVYGTTCGLTISQDQFTDYQPEEGSQTISINTYPEGAIENGVTFHATSFFSWFVIDRVGGFTITRGNKGEGSVADPPEVQNVGGGTAYNPPENNRGPITDFIPPISSKRIMDLLGRLNDENDPGNTEDQGSIGNAEENEGNSQPPLTDEEIISIMDESEAGVGPITVTLAWQTGDDLDLHVITPNGSRIYHRNKTAQGGTLDMDMNVRDYEIRIPAVENVYFPDPENGHYKVFVRDYYDRTSKESTHYVVKVKVGDTEQKFEGDIDNDRTEQSVFEFDYNEHGQNSTLPGEPTMDAMRAALDKKGARSGKITVSAMWNRYDDVDLHVVGPGDAHIYYCSKNAGGGRLDVESNASGQRILNPVENIFFEYPRNGHYRIYLNESADRSDDSASYIVRIEIDGEVKEFTGTIDGTGTDVPIFEFDYNGAENILSGEFGGHRYEYYPDANISWTEARSMAQSLGGHLVTITSDAEQSFIENTFPGTTGWIGAYGDNNGWSWVTGEPFGIYQKWKSGEPNDQGGIEWCGHIWSDMTWNDLDNKDISGYQTGFYVEYDEYGDGTTYVGTPATNVPTNNSTASGEAFESAIPFTVGQTVDNQSIELDGQEHVFYTFITGDAGEYTITMKHPKDYYGSAHAIFKLSDADKNRISEEEWFVDEITRTYTLYGNFKYYLEVWDYVIFSVTSGGSANTDASGGYWNLTKVSPYVYDGVNGRYVEGTSSHYNNGEDMYEIDFSESGTNGVLTYNNPYYTNMYHEFIGTGKASATFTMPKTAYAAEETAEVSFELNASDTDKGYAFIDMQVDFWTGPHTKDDLSFTQGSRFYDEAQNAYSFEAGSSNYNSGREKASLSAHVTGDFPSAPYDLTDDKLTVVNIRIDSYLKGTLVYTYEWTTGSMPADVGAATGYISGGSTGSTGTNVSVPDGAVSGTYSGHTYAVIEKELDPISANEYCKSLGGYLATITSQGEQDYVAGLAARVDYSNFWIGGSDSGSEGSWYWLNGEPWSYTAWYPGGPAGSEEPNNGLGSGEDYVFMNKERDYNWVDGYGGYSMAPACFICEWGDADTAGNGSGTAGSLTEMSIQTERGKQGAGDGKITITLMWDSNDDLDLHIFTPNGSELWWNNPSAQGGTFDIDANSNGNIKENPIENAYFLNPANGEYWVYIYNYEDRTPNKSTSWILRVQVGDEEKTYSGFITNQEETIEVLGFSYNSTGSQNANTGTSGNLLVNGNASGGMNGWTAPDGKWTTDINYDGVEAYDSYYFCTKNFSGTEGSRMYQDVDVSGYAGKTAVLSAMNRAYRSGHTDESMLMIEFLNSAGSVISSASSEKDSQNGTWHSLSVKAKIPTVAVKARVSLYTFYKEGVESDSYFDNVSFAVS